MPKKTTDKTQLGLYLGKDAFSLVEASDKQATKAAHIHFDTPLDNKDNQPVPDDLKFPALLQAGLRQAGATVTQVNLTLTTKDFIFRSFVIPWMPPQEAKNVIDFEATKYIPIPLEDLMYTYHTVNFTENTQKNMRVLFFAARKDLLSRYTGFIEQAGREVHHIEPEPVSLTRLLLKQGRLSPKQSSAVIVVGNEEGKIFIIEEQTVQFVREFQMPSQIDDPAMLRVKLFNEIRISFSFYTRQNPQGKIDSMIILSTTAIENLDKELTREFNKPVAVLTLTDCLRGVANLPGEIGLLNAFGNACRDKGIYPSDFELAEKIRRLQKADEAAKVKFRQYITSGGIIAGCLAFAILVVFLAGQIKKSEINRIAELKKKEGTYTNLKTADLEQLQTDTAAKLNSYKAIRLRSDVGFYLFKVPSALPEQSWLRSLSIGYQQKTPTAGKSSTQPTLSLDGYIYIPEANDQYRFVMNMVDSIKRDADFKRDFETVTLDSMTQESYNNTLVVTLFRISCK